MAQPSFHELFVSRNQSGAEVADRYADFTRGSFNYEDGIPVVVGTHKGDDIPVLLTALGRSDAPIAPIVVDNRPGQNTSAALAEYMGARVIEQPLPGYLSAMRTGIQHAADHFSGRPVIITDDDCLPPRGWVKTMARHADFASETGGIAFGGVVIDHGPSFAADALRTVYAFAGDGMRKVLRSTPKARGPSAVLRLDAAGRILDNLWDGDVHFFPGDVLVRDCVIAAGGGVRSIFLPAAVTFTRGDRFNSLAVLARDAAQRGKRRAELYRDHGN